MSAPSLVETLKNEILRLSRKSARQEIDPLQRKVAQQAQQLKALREQVEQLSRQLRLTHKVAARSARQALPEAPASPLRFQARGLVTLRARLGLTAADLGRLVGVSAQAIYNWEKGVSRPRLQQLEALDRVRGIGKREVAKRLAALDETASNAPSVT